MSFTIDQYEAAKLMLNFLWPISYFLLYAVIWDVLLQLGLTPFQIEKFCLFAKFQLLYCKIWLLCCFCYCSLLFFIYETICNDFLESLSLFFSRSNRIVFIFFLRYFCDLLYLKPIFWLYVISSHR